MTTRRKLTAAGVALALAFTGAACNDEDGDGNVLDEEIDNAEETLDEVEDEAEEVVDDVQSEIDEQVGDDNQ